MNECLVCQGPGGRAWGVYALRLPGLPLVGALPSELLELTELVTLDVLGKQLEGPIPE